MKLSGITEKKLLTCCGYTIEGINAIRNGIEMPTEQTVTIQKIVNDFMFGKSRILLLTGSTGIGKSYIVQKECAEWFINQKLSVADDIYKVAYLRYCFHYDIRLDDLSSLSFKAEKNPKQTYDLLCNINLLIIDEFCEFNITPSDLSYIENVIKKRYVNNNKTILVSNRTLQELQQKLTPAFLDRVFSSRFSMISSIEGKSLRNEANVPHSNS